MNTVLKTILLLACTVSPTIDAAELQATKSGKASEQRQPKENGMSIQERIAAIEKLVSAGGIHSIGRPEKLISVVPTISISPTGDVTYKTALTYSEDGYKKENALIFNLKDLWEIGPVKPVFANQWGVNVACFKNGCIRSNYLTPSDSINLPIPADQRFAESFLSMFIGIAKEFKPDVRIREQ